MKVVDYFAKTYRKRLEYTLLPAIVYGGGGSMDKSMDRSMGKASKYMYMPIEVY